MKRRHFLESSTAILMSHSLAKNIGATTSQGNEANVIVGVMGLSRGLDLALELLKIPGVEVRYACDVDQKRADGAAKKISDAGGRTTPIQDFRRILDDPAVDALFCAAPNHWHGPATLLACKAGKHVYVEKPACHNPQEGEWMVRAAEKYNRCVQVGTQRRSSLGYRNAISKLHAGAIGKVTLGRAFYRSLRGSIGTRADSVPPESLNYEMWQGPAPHRPYRDNVVHYNWHWFWNWGNGELGNNGVHLVDICRWGMQVDYPTRSVSSGGRFHHLDDQETPDTQSVAWMFDGERMITYEGLSCTKHANGPFVSFYGSDGYMEIDGDGGFRIFNANDKETESSPATGAGQPEHVANFIDAVRSNDPTKLNQPILSGHQSTLLCHLGNIAHRTGTVVHSRTNDGHILDANLPDGLWQREYDSHWEKLLSEV